ncbi:arylsulfatase B [Bemisia tabaci]|uniref:arylsulfatase B n=1 Tax=Bemisia tabaci TaxID=7038 RepID=UPI003B2875B9
MARDGINTVSIWCLFILQWFASAKGNSNQPHIIFIIADDLGWNDVGFHGSNQIPTPNIDALAYNGIVLDRHYTQPCCTPSRAALLTGKYPIRMGLQGLPIAAGHADGIPLNETLLPEYLQKLGYVTRLIGKWHVGSSTTSMTPSKRGFHSHFGYYNGFVSYKSGIHRAENISGFDAYRNLVRSKHEVEGQYLTDVYTKEAVRTITSHGNPSTPLFLVISHLAPHTGAAGVLEVRDEAENSKKFGHISDPARRLYAGVVEALDSSVGAVVEALSSKNMLQNSVIIFISDNGGPTIDPVWGHGNTASNWPLRGLKMSPFEGGVRGVAVIWSALFKNLRWTSSAYMHITDWLPTLYSAAGGDASSLEGLDGTDQWDFLLDVTQADPKNEFLVNINEDLNDWAVVKNEWKLIHVNTSTPFSFSQLYYGEHGRNRTEYSLKMVTDSPTSKNLRKDQPFGKLWDEYMDRRSTLDITRTMLCAERIAASETSDPFFPRDRCSGAPCLFNIHQDPCEFDNVAEDNPEIVEEMLHQLEGYRSGSVKIQNHPFDPASDPEKWGGWWAPWLDPKDSIA